jgi:ABC-type proline/glycine betaine transport system ATPase subunit
MKQVRGMNKLSYISNVFLLLRLSIKFFFTLWVIFVAILNCEARIENGKAIIVHGVSSSGKSTLLAEATKSDNRIYPIMLDEHMEKCALEFLEKNYHYEFSVISSLIPRSQQYENIIQPPILVKNSSLKEIAHFLLFLKSKRAENIEFIYQNARESLVNEATIAYKEGRYVLIDTVIDRDEYLEKYIKQFNKALSIVMVYCSPDILIKRVIARNSHARTDMNSKNYRSPVKVLEQYVSLFIFYNNYEKDDYIEKISKEQLKQAFFLAASNDARFKEKNTSIEEALQKFLSKFDHLKEDKLYVVSKISANKVIRTDWLSPGEAAEILVNYFNKNN